MGGLLALCARAPRLVDGAAERPLLIKRVFGTSDHAFAGFGADDPAPIARATVARTFTIASDIATYP